MIEMIENNGSYKSPVNYAKGKQNQKFKDANQKKDEGTVKPTDRTSIIHSIFFNEDDITKLAQNETNKIHEQMDELSKELSRILQNDFIMMENKKIWMDTELLALYPNPDAYDIPVIYDNEQGVKNYNEIIEGFQFRTPKFNELATTFSLKRKNPYVTENRLFKYLWDLLPEQARGADVVRYKGKACYSSRLATKTPYDSHLRVYQTFAPNDACSIYSATSPATGCLLIPICCLREEKISEHNQAIPRLTVLSCLVENGLVPKGISENNHAIYEWLTAHWDCIKNFLLFQDKKLYFDNKGFMDAGIENLKTNPLKLAGKLKNYQKEKLLNCDYIRANITPYDEKRLTDINLGHWELAEFHTEKMQKLAFADGENWVARPPQMDVRYGICAIDFGTKSTIVACRDENQDERLRRIGKGDFSSEPKMTDFENPTSVELRHFINFKKDYNAREGRPFTKWSDVTVSHQAAEAVFNATYTGAYYSVFNELKQWANDPQRRMLLSDLDGNIVDLKPYQEIQNGDFDPIEIYAYYLGLYINNMTNGIYLDYILSFPVNYSVGIREKIRQSFEKGIRKSLPPAILRDTEVMKHFRIQQGCSEPAAYAITALQEFGLEPKNEEDAVAYGVFDFGGGTTDFDFGVASVPRSRYNMQIVQFGYGGDPYLGGENLLLLMAYELFKENVNQMREKKIHMVLPAGARRFTGSEVLVEERQSASQEAYLNSRELQQFLRPVWEKEDGFDNLGQGEQTIQLYPSNGTGKTGVSVKVDIPRLDQLVKERIEQGVDNFFAKLTEAFQNQSYEGKIHIFLAGNSCKAQVVKTLFHEKIQALDKEMQKEQHAKGLFELHDPLPVQKEPGSNDGKRTQKPENREWDRIRTGKTGVAFGLIRCRKGARDVKVINKNDETENTETEVRFPYYLGEIRRDRKFHITVGLDIPYGTWVQYIDASEDEFELCYTKDARAQKGDLMDRDIPRCACYLDENEISEDENIGVYIRKIDPETLEYAVGKVENKDGQDIFVPKNPGQLHKVRLR